MPNSNNFYSRDPFEIFKVGNSSQSGGDGGFGNSPKSPVAKVILVVFLIIGIAAAFVFQDVIKKFFFGETPKKKVKKPEAQETKKTDVEVEIKEKAEPETENPEEGTGATIVE